MQFHRNRLTGVWLVEVDGEWLALMPAADPDTGDLYCILEAWEDPGAKLEPRAARDLWPETGWTPARIEAAVARLLSSSN